MSSVPVEIVVYNNVPMTEFTLHLSGDTTLGSLRDMIHAHIGDGGRIDRAWVAFEAEGRGMIPFGHATTESDGLQIRFLRCSQVANSPVSVGIFRCPMSQVYADEK
jgi:hypothetical protein